MPIDPYDGEPMKFAMVDGQPIVYSVGRDGKDDGGLVDSDRDQKPAGDLIYRLPVDRGETRAKAVRALRVRRGIPLSEN